MKRRDFLRLGLSSLAAAATHSLWVRGLAAAPGVGGPSPYGPLQIADANGLELPQGFRSRIVAQGETLVPGTSYLWHRSADGGAVLRTPGGYVYVSNSERGNGAGGASALRFDHRGNLIDAYPICSGTSRNCAGGATPWGTWLSCEEVDLGLVYECDPHGIAPHVARPALGSFKHEAVAVDPERRRLYLSEDQGDGLLYRFTPDTWGDLSSGTLEAAVTTGPNVTWTAVPNPNPGLGDDPTRAQVPAAATFNGGEGIVYHAGLVFLTTKGDDRVWRYDPTSELISVIYEAGLDPSQQLTDVDNIDAARSGDLVVAEDSGNLELVLLTPDCVASPLVRITGQSSTEVTGPAFDPLGRRLYFSSQRGGPTSAGITYEVEGPFRRLA